MLTTNDTRLNELIADAHRIIKDGLAQRKNADVYMYILFSGGKDSIVTSKIVEHYPEFRGAIYVNTDTGPISQDHAQIVSEYADAQNWQFYTDKPATTFPMLVVKSGFPGPGSHNWMYRMLKERVINQIKKRLRESARKQDLVFATGIRKYESTRRSESPEIVDKTKSERWISPILNWRDEDVRDFIDLFNIDVPNYHHSLDCGCGAFAQPGERDHLMQDERQKFYIEGLETMVYQAREIQRLQGDANAIPTEFCRWGHGGRGVEVDADDPGSISLCNTCVGKLDSVGNVGLDPDWEMLRVKKIQEINSGLK